ncbi:hypothetical protein ETB97_007620 [Aspergillus alliaceus]|uniref:Uncharacterized protein n=1 Tax=Petromyces alliaceus TaxID=209559 RepID=A0A8H6E1W1_PETAA|nr:hypothetical protein ETB97_007620 [Aspergillus burnettii]
MDPEKAERLSRLQMEDLGTARREHISTVDDKKVKEARLEDIEATRLSNQPGTQAQRLAQQNQQQLTEWKNVFQKLSDTNDLENLDDLLNGQSHRLKLSAALHGAGAYGNNNNSSRATTDYPKLSETLVAAPTRTGKPRGRGGGIFGTRSRTGARVISVSASHDASSSKPGHHIPQASGARKASLDPALNGNNNDFFSKGRERQVQNKTQNQVGKNKGNGTRNPTPAVVKTRRPIGDNIPRFLSPPERFLAEARKILHTRASEAVPAVAKNDSNLSRNTPKLPLQESRAAQEKDVACSTQVIAKTSAPPLSEEKPVTIPTPTKAPNESRMAPPDTAKVTRSPKVANITPVDQDGKPTSMNFKIAKEDQSTSEPVSEQSQAKEKPQMVIPAPKLPLPSSPSENWGLNKIPDNIEEVLLDLSSTPPSKDSLANNDSPVLSPSLQDLKGLDFKQSPSDTPKTPLPHPPQRRLEFENLPNDMVSNGKSSALTHALEEETPDNYQRAIELLCELMALTSLSEQNRGRLEECKADLDAKLQTIQQTPMLSPISPGPSAENITKPDISLTDSQDQGSCSPPSRLDVTAAPFTPSTPDVSFTPTHARPRSASFAIHLGHIFGDHLLPGRLEHQGSLQIDEAHIFGNHLLPGRRQVSELGSTQVKFSIPNRKSVLLKARLLGFDRFEDSDPTSHQPLGDNTQKDIRTTPVSKAVRKLDILGRLQQSIHAPRENETPAARSGGQALGGLQSSIYAVPEKNKPIR